jgi:hypothetical protein
LAASSDAFSESDEDKRWLVERIDGLLRNMEDIWKSDRDKFLSLMTDAVDGVTNWRNNVWVVVSSLITILLSLFAVGLVDRPIVIDVLLLLVVVPLGLTVALNWVRGFIEDRFGRVDDVYAAGLKSILYMRGSFYLRTLDVHPMSLHRIRIFDEFARAAIASQYAAVLRAYSTSLGMLLRGAQRTKLSETVNMTQDYVDHGYRLFKEKRSDMLDPNEFSPDLIAMLNLFEQDFEAEAKKKGAKNEDDVKAGDKR